jgi:hypothetical protein
MLERLNEVTIKINLLKRKLTDLWQVEGRTDQEILELAEKIDVLLNEYYFLLQKIANERL